MKHLNTNQEFRFNEILFEHRNKEYGAYALRNESDRILTKALFIGVSLLAAISITPLAISAFKADAPTEQPPIIHEFIPIDIVETPPVKVTPVQPPAVVPEKVKTYDDRLPDPKKVLTNEKKDNPEDRVNAVAGTQTSPGKEVTTPAYVPTAPTIGTGPVINTAPPTIPQPVDKNKILSGGELAVEANFEGGINTFRNKVISNFDGSGFENEDVMKTTITFIVETNGTISGIKADGKDANFNSEAIRTIKSIRGKWVPGKNKQGESVRSYFKFPISMKFDN